MFSFNINTGENAASNCANEDDHKIVPVPCTSSGALHTMSQDTEVLDYQVEGGPKGGDAAT